MGELGRAGHPALITQGLWGREEVAEEGRGNDTLIEVVQVIEKDEPDVQPAQGEEEGEEEQAKPETVTLQRGRREAHSWCPIPIRIPVEGSSRWGRALTARCGTVQLYRQLFCTGGRFFFLRRASPSPQLPLSIFVFQTL